MSNLLKGYWVNVDNDEKRTVDSNELVALRVREEEERRARLQAIADEGYEVSDFTEGLDAENLDALLEDDSESHVIKAEDSAVSSARSELDEVNSMLEAAKIEFENIKQETSEYLEQANSEAERIKADAYEEGKSQGYQDGYQQGMASVDSMKAELDMRSARMEEEYQNRIYEMEPGFVDALTDIYEHIFKVDLESYRKIVSQLLIDTIIETGENKNVIVHISRNDFSEITAKKTEILEETGMMENNLDFVMDATLSDSQCIIETENGVYDCSLETELKELKRKLMILAYHRE